MRIVHRTTTGDRIVEIDIADASCGVNELLTVLGEPLPGEDEIDAVIDGVAVTADRPLSAVTMCEGSVVDTTTSQGAATPSPRTLTVVGGVRAGVAVDLGAGLTVGRATDSDLRIDDPALSRHHLRVTADAVHDLGSHNGTAIEGHAVRGEVSPATDTTIRAGATRLAIRALIDDRPVAVRSALGAVGGTIPFNRPPRIDPPVRPPELLVPGAPPEPPAAEPLSMAGIILPVIAGGVVAVLFSPFMAIFAALGPVLTVGTWWERRRRSRRVHRGAMATFAEDLARLAHELPGRRAAEIARRRGLHPDPGEVVRRARAPSVRCWERRPDHADAFVVGLGGIDDGFRPPMVAVAGDMPAEDAVALVAAQPAMPDVPLPVDLSAGHVVGLVGDRGACLAIARSLVLQMATHHGPADLAVAVGADDRAPWEWCRWLPHTADPASGRRGAHVLHTDDVGAADALLTATDGRTLLAVVDGDDPFQGRATSGRRFLRGAATALIVLVGDTHRLPAGCDTVVTTDEMGRMSVQDPRRADGGREALAWGIGPDVANDAARRLARLDDPELPVAGAGVPATASLLGLLGVSGDDPAEIESRWTRTDDTADLAVPIGAAGEGPVILDLVGDGPHVLVGGTTGSGKSELLRSLVAGVAATADPDHVAIVLVDYKGGAAFDCCAELPHVAGLVTDLDETLAARALRCLEAELRYRERRLREVGAEDMRAFRIRASSRRVEPLPRLLVVVDEFATLAAELPDFLDALVGIAQRGRSLGVHLVLATQRPAGVVTDDIRANTSCRIALRVTDRADSIDVIDSGEAAAIPRERAGRAVARFGPGELVTFQSALATGHSGARAAVSLRTDGSPVAGVDGPTDLHRLVATIVDAHDRRGGPRPRSPWPPELPARRVRDRAAPPTEGWLLVDEPDRQRQTVSSWTPADGHLVVVGGPGAGATTTLATAVLATTRDRGADAPHVHVIDLDSGGLVVLSELRAVGTVVGPTDAVRRARLVRWLDGEIGRRRGGAATSGPPMILVIDDLGGLARAHDPVREADIHERLARIWADGPSVGVVVAASIRRATDLAPNLAATVGTVLLHRTTDQSDGLRFSMRTSTDGFGPGRAVRSGDGAIVQIILESESVAEAVAARTADVAPCPPPHDVGELAVRVAWDDLRPRVRFDDDGVMIQVGIRDADLEPAVLRIHRGAHALVLGPSRSGRTNLLAAVARAAGEAVIIVGDGESDLARRAGRVPVPGTDLESALAGRDAALVLVDDCTSVADDAGALARVIGARSSRIHVVAAARPDRYRAAYGHWSAEIRASRVGLLLRPDPIDGDLLGEHLPARLGLPPVPGRGVLVVDGTREVVQVVAADDQESAG